MDLIDQWNKFLSESSRVGDKFKSYEDFLKNFPEMDGFEYTYKNDFWLKKEGNILHIRQVKGSYMLPWNEG